MSDLDDGEYHDHYMRRRRKNQDEAELQDALFVSCMDETSEQEDDCSRERILEATWNHASEAFINPLGVARSLPWDIFQPPEGGSWIPKLLTAPISSFDSSLPGEPMYQCYVNRFLPGVVEWHHEVESLLTNAEAWDTKDFENKIRTELARFHPGDDPADNEKIDKKNSTAGRYEEASFSPITTKAGSRLWSISFADEKECTDLKACYPGQFLIRFDTGRNMIFYDCFEFVPTTLQAFEADVTAGKAPCTQAELLEVEELLRKTLQKRKSYPMRNFSAQIYGDPVANQPETANQNQPFEERWRHIAKHKLYYLLNWVRFKKSRLLRLRFPLDAICGARFVALDHERPHANDIPAAKGTHPTERIHKFHNRYKNDETSPSYKLGRGSFELCDDTLEPIGMLVLEVEKAGEFFEDEKNKHPFASTVVWPNKWRDRKRLAMDADWTPDRCFSRSKRHYIVGDASEIKELANTLAHKSPKLRAMLCPEVAAETCQPMNSLSTQDLTTVLDSFNTLLGSLESLHPGKTPPGHTKSLQYLCSEQLLRQHKVPVLSTPQEERQFETKEAVHDFLRRCGVEEPEYVNSCVKAALLNGHLKVPSELLHASDASEYLGAVLLTDTCPSMFCGNTRTCAMRDALYQSEKGTDEESEYTRTAVQCGGAFCSGKYISKLCQGTPEFTRQNHNHCTLCADNSGFGTCVGYFRNRHCTECNLHWVPGHTRCDCSRRAQTGHSSVKVAQVIDTHGASASSWEGYFRDTSAPVEMEILQKKDTVHKIRKSLLDLRITAIIEENEEARELAKHCFYPVNPRDIRYPMEELDRWSLEDLNEFQSKLTRYETTLAHMRSRARLRRMND